MRKTTAARKDGKKLLDSSLFTRREFDNSSRCSEEAKPNPITSDSVFWLDFLSGFPLGNSLKKISLEKFSEELTEQLAVSQAV